MNYCTRPVLSDGVLMTGEQPQPIPSVRAAKQAPTSLHPQQGDESTSGALSVPGSEPSSLPLYFQQPYGLFPPGRRRAAGFLTHRRWHPSRGGSCGDFHRLFWNPVKPEETFHSSSAEARNRWGPAAARVAAVRARELEDRGASWRLRGPGSTPGSSVPRFSQSCALGSGLNFPIPRRVSRVADPIVLSHREARRERASERGGGISRRFFCGRPSSGRIEACGPMYGSPLFFETVPTVVLGRRRPCFDSGSRGPARVHQAEEYASRG